MHSRFTTTFFGIVVAAALVLAGCGGGGGNSSGGFGAIPGGNGGNGGSGGNGGNGSSAGIVFNPSSVTFGANAYIGETITVTMVQHNGNRTFAIPSGALVCQGSLSGQHPVTYALTNGNVLKVTLVSAGITGTCALTVNDPTGKSSTLPINLNVPANGTAGIVFNPSSVNFGPTSYVGEKVTVTMSQSDGNTTFTIPSGALVCQGALAGKHPIAYYINGTKLTIVLASWDISGTCTLRIDDNQGRYSQTDDHV